MLERITVGRGACGLCGVAGTVFYLEAEDDRGRDVTVPVCERCGYAVGKGSAVLLALRTGRAKAAKPTKKPRKRATGQPGAIAPYVGPSKHDVSSLVPADKDLVSSGQPGAMS